MTDTHSTSAASTPRGVLLALSDDADILRAIDTPGSGMTVVRRCADTAELLSAALADLGTLAVIGTSFDDLDRTVLDRLNRAGVTGLLLAPEADCEHWSGFGWPVESSAATPAEVCARLQAISRGRPPSAERFTPAPATGSGLALPVGTGLWDEFDAISSSEHPQHSARPGVEHMGAAEPTSARGRLVVVWGPQGAPGRTTLAASLAAGLTGGAILVDADIEAPSLTQLLGLPEDSSSLATAARLASRGRLDAETLDRILVPISEGRRLLTGLGRPGRWRELPPAAMSEVWEQCRHSAPWTVVDIAGGQVDDAVDDFTLEPGRGAMAAELLRSADVVVMVGAGDPIGVRRLLQLIDDLDGTLRLSGRIEVAVNRVRASAAGPSPQRAVREALARYGGVEEVTVLPEDAQTTDRCLMEGRPVLESAPTSPLGRALTELVDRIDPHSGAALRAERASRGTHLHPLAALLRSWRRERPAQAAGNPGGGRTGIPGQRAASPETGPVTELETKAVAVEASTPPPPPPPLEADTKIVPGPAYGAYAATPTTAETGTAVGRVSPRHRGNGRHRA
ncbi:hypothetical protein [Actinomyces sp.]|uniref:AAA family ATPase n=1 Tax=Actinomyces sp. TaxID=29317 RepID=UPI0026DB9459|nr:hypothetical protein [Actinomyces sp.]MDO4899416.1 hypothetical protein [Actinomyces sp.]